MVIMTPVTNDSVNMWPQLTLKISC